VDSSFVTIMRVELGASTGGVTISIGMDISYCAGYAAVSDYRFDALKERYVGGKVLM